MRKLIAALAMVALLHGPNAFAAYYPLPVAVTAGGTGVSTITAHGIVVGEGASPVVAVGPTADSVLVWGSASSDPTTAGTASTADSVLAWGAAASTPAPLSVPLCLSNLTYNTATHAFVCNQPTAHSLVIGEGAAAFVSLGPTADSVPVWGSAASDPTTAGTSATADSVLGWAAAGSTPAPLALLSCSAGSSALTYNTGTHVFGCNTITGSGAVATNVLTAAGPFTLSTTYDTVNISRMGTPAAATYNLPSAVTAGNGFRGCLKDDTTNFATNNATIKSPTAGNIDGTTGSTGVVFNVQRMQICYISDGTNWFLN